MSRHIYIYAPGFPGEAIPREDNEVRLIDHLKVIISNGLEIISYPGIFGSGDFTFKKSLEYTLSIIQEKAEQGYEITLIGNSWGGLISLIASTNLSVKKILLITPFVIRPSQEELKEILNYYSEAFPNLVRKESSAFNTQDINDIFSKLENILLSKIITNLKIFAANQDEIVSINKLRDFLEEHKLLNEENTITVSENDHNFSNGFSEINSWLVQNV